MATENQSRSAARASRYTVNPADRVRELLHVETIPETAVLSYSFDQGYEKLDYQEVPEYGGVHYAGSYHPDGMCDGPHICSYCGRTMFDAD